jgi:uncharacterized membrane protein YkvA (DUF1232 family)
MNFEQMFDAISRHAAFFGREIIEKALILIFAFQDERTPPWARAIIVASLAYLLLPLDACPDFLPIAGLSDDIAALLGAATAISGTIRPEHIQRARATSRAIFGF